MQDLNSFCGGGFEGKIYIYIYIFFFFCNLLLIIVCVSNTSLDC